MDKAEVVLIILSSKTSAMFTALLLYIFTRIRKSRLVKKNILMMAFLPLSTLAPAQQLQYQYEILRNGKKTGNITIVQKREGSRETINLVAMIRTNLVIGISIRSEENTLFENGRIIRSSFLRSINNSRRISRSLALENNSYIIYADGIQRRTITEQISHNMATIYLKEPVSLQRIYSDAAEQFLSIQKLSPGIYQVILTDGGKNIYHFENSICKKIEVKQKLFNAEILLRSISQL
jgi:hypothetical protein